MSLGAWSGQRVSALVGWLRAHDPALAATRRAGRTAVVMPALFALCTQVFHSPTMASFAAFGSFSMLLLVDFSGTLIQRLRAQFALAVAWAVLICLGTVVARVTWLSVLATLVVAFCVLFSGVVSSVLAGSSTALLLAFVLPVATPVPLDQLPDRLIGAGLAAAAALPAVTLLWPRPAADPLSGPAARVCRAAAALLRADASATGGHRTFNLGACQIAADETAAANADLRRMFDATPYRPTGLSTSSRTLVRLVDELTWLSAILTDRPDYTEQPPACDPAARTARLAAAEVLDRAADLLTDFRGDVSPLRSGVRELQSALAAMEASSTARLPVDQPVGESPDEVYTFISTLDFSFRALELGFAVVQIAENVSLAAQAFQRSWPDRLLGREPGALTKPLTSARERAGAHLGWNSVWLHNSLRGAVGLAIAILLADLTSVQHSFWVLLGTLSVLRSNALNTGQNAMRAVLGTVLGSIIGAGMLQLIGHHGTVLWVLLPIAILIAGIAPAAISFTAGQAAFTVTLVILFNIGQNPDWHIVLLRIQDIALGCGVSVVVALFFWPRGAAAAVDKALAKAYTDSARYLSGAVAYALGHCDAGKAGLPAAEPVAAQSREAAASARRLDDAYRTYLAERGAKPLSLADTTTLVTGVVGLRLAADSVVALWQNSGRTRPKADQSAAHSAILEAADSVTGWYQGLADSLGGSTPIPAPVPLLPESAARLVDSVRTDLVDRDGQATAAAVRVIWTGDHVDVARRLQPGIAAAAKEAVLR
ncbi:FUSC family protein [Catenulispora sp. NF23]|uniref:FUSC family protein n=1 Tax=Catenulispora pinistramenti TaxID=2705254 RepID=A0ABS5KTM6_9ACTN|nr:FUSC family protein [Catenulispora pinistramenti]MBS2533681.1 FUSC family protein [Catenulispora pinistramenti]MBS2549421.1 FUSC family protein [Catenulispora pinistramenti]